MKKLFVFFMLFLASNCAINSAHALQQVQDKPSNGFFEELVRSFNKADEDWSKKPDDEKLEARFKKLVVPDSQADKYTSNRIKRYLRGDNGVPYRLTTDSWHKIRVIQVRWVDDNTVIVETSESRKWKNTKVIPDEYAKDDVINSYRIVRFAENDWRVEVNKIN
ncbi:MAG TPA: hypothetical protein VEA59_00810 [Patescibacteria group bacterium]|nr:hypothetical protein [Patescibacteria group bacterium]